MVIRFKSKDIPENIVIPKGGTFDDWDNPFTSYSFTAEIKGRIGVPEFTMKKGSKISLKMELKFGKLHVMVDKLYMQYSKIKLLK